MIPQFQATTPVVDDVTGITITRMHPGEYRSTATIAAAMVVNGWATPVGREEAECIRIEPGQITVQAERI